MSRGSGSDDPLEKNLTKIPQNRVDDLMQEIVMAEKLNEDRLQGCVEEAISRYVGEHVPVIGQDWDVILNEVYPVIQNNLPSIFFRNPRAFLKPRRKTFIAKKRNLVSGKMEEVQLDSSKSAKSQEHILNYTISEIKYKNEIRKVLLDALLFPHGVLWHGYKGDFGMTEEQSFFIKDENVFVQRVSPMRFIKDPSVNMVDMEAARWQGRIIDIPYQDFIEDDKLDIKDKRKIKGFQGFGDKLEENNGKDSISLHRNSIIDFTNDNFKKSNSSRFVRAYEIFLRPTKKEKREGKKGYILLLTNEQKEPLRVSDWKIKAEGFPGKILEFNPINDRMFSLPDIDTYKDIADHKNAIVNLQLRNAQENSKVWVGISKAGANEEDIEKIRQGENTIILFEDDKPSDRMYVASPGGAASSELYILDQRIQKNLEDKSGVTDLKRGFLQSGEESATSVKMRAAGGSARPLYRQDLMADFLKESLIYINHLNKQFMTFDDAVRVMGTLDIQWSENPSKEELQADVDVEIDVISMLPDNPEQELRSLTETLSLMVQALTSPEIQAQLQKEGKTIELSPLVEQILLRQRINNPDIFRTIKPEESEGFVSVQQIRQARENVNAALTNQAPPFPPTEEDDHRAKLEVYLSIKDLLDKAGQISDMLERLIMVQSQLLQMQEEKEERPGQSVDLDKPKVQTV